jgi:hypothetical protein
MEVFTASTPTSSGNYKAILETLPAEYDIRHARGILALAPSYEVGCEASGRPEHLGWQVSSRS